MSTVCSIEDVKRDPAAVIKSANATKEPVFVAQGNRSFAVIVDADTYLTQMQALHEFERIYGVGPSHGRSHSVAQAIKDKPELGKLEQVFSEA